MNMSSSSRKSSSKASSNPSEHSHTRSHKQHSKENHRQHHRPIGQKVGHEGSQDSQSQGNAHHSEGSMSRGDPENELYRMDEGAEIWRTADGSVILWEVHKLTFKQFSQALWEWAERGLDHIQKSYVASIRPPHAGHRSRLMEFFCPHRQKLIRNHIQRIYSDLYLILRTWTELRHYLRQLNAKPSLQKDSKTIKKLENRLTFYLMVSLREYTGLPLDPKYPDKASWPSEREGNEARANFSLLKSDALASTSSICKSSGSEKSILLSQDTGVICSHCHQVLDHSPVDNPVENNVKSMRLVPLPSSPSEAPESSQISGFHHRKEKTARSKSRSREEENKSEPSKSAQESGPSCSSRAPPKSPGKSNRTDKHTDKKADDSDNASLISFDSNQFSNSFGTMFNLI